MVLVTRASVQDLLTVRRSHSDRRVQDLVNMQLLWKPVQTPRLQTMQRSFALPCLCFSSLWHLQRNAQAVANKHKEVFREQLAGVEMWCLSPGPVCRTF